MRQKLGEKFCCTTKQIPYACRLFLGKSSNYGLGFVAALGDLDKF
jgi:hypothetical protein